MIVVEDYAFLELAGTKQFDAELTAQHWSTTYISPTVRIMRRVADGARWLYAKADAEEVTGEISRLLSEPVEIAAPVDAAGETGEAGEAAPPVVDDRPLWQRRLDEEKAGEVDDGSGSQIP